MDQCKAWTHGGAGTRCRSSVRDSQMTGGHSGKATGTTGTRQAALLVWEWQRIGKLRTSPKQERLIGQPAEGKQIAALPGIARGAPGNCWLLAEFQR